MALTMSLCSSCKGTEHGRPEGRASNNWTHRTVMSQEFTEHDTPDSGGIHFGSGALLLTAAVDQGHRFV